MPKVPPLFNVDMDINPEDKQRLQEIMCQSGTHLTFVRHGETESVAEGVFAGSAYDAILTPKGEAEVLGVRDSIYALVPPTAFISSGLKRTNRTACLLAAHDRDIAHELIVSDGLQERNWGSWTRRSKKALPQDPSVKPDSWEGDFIAPESDQALGQRCFAALLKLMTTQGEKLGKTPLMASHRGVMTLLFKILGFEVDPGTAATYQLTADKSGFKLYHMVKKEHQPAKWENVPQHVVANQYAKANPAALAAERAA